MGAAALDVKAAAAVLVVCALWGAGEAAITLLNQATGCGFKVTVLSPCLKYKVVYNKEPMARVEEYVNVQGCAANFAVFSVPAAMKSVTVDVDDGAYVVIQDSPTAHIVGLLLDDSRAVMSTLFTI